MSKNFCSTMRKGFHMTFENGVTASVQWGAGNYCDNHVPADMDFSCQKDSESDTAEVAAFRNGELITQDVAPDMCDCDDVIGWLSPEDVLKFMNKCKEYGK